mgnify:CR=1 FL=1
MDIKIEKPEIDSVIPITEKVSVKLKYPEFGNLTKDNEFDTLTELTFATDKEVIFEELILLLQNSGFNIDTADILADADIYNALGVKGEKQLQELNRSIQADVSSFIGGIKKNGSRFKRRIRSKLAGFGAGAVGGLGDKLQTSGTARKSLGGTVSTIGSSVRI